MLINLLLTLDSMYINEERIPGFLAPGYRVAGMRLTQHWKDFRATLTEEQVKNLDALQSEESSFRRMEEVAAFRATLSVGIELSRL